MPKSYVRAEAAPKLATGSDAFDAAAYLTPHSDVVALMVLNHQTRMTNLLTRLGWQSRIAAHGGTNAGGPAQQVRETAHELVDYMLFVEEAPLPSPVRGASAFTREFPAKGPRDSKGRSLRDLDLTRRLFRYPCSYMIYTEAFDALPAATKAIVYERMWAILSGTAKDADYRSSRPPTGARLSRSYARRNRIARGTFDQGPAKAGHYAYPQSLIPNPESQVSRIDRLPLPFSR